MCKVILIHACISIEQAFILAQAYVPSLSVAVVKTLARLWLCRFYLETLLLTYAIIRNYLSVFWLSPEVSTQDPIISPRALARGLIMAEG